MKGALETESINWHSVAVVGEYTNSLGPSAEDYFIVVVLRSGEWREFPIGEAKEVIAIMEEATGIKMKLELANKTAEASRILFPEVLVGHPLFTFTPLKQGFFGRIRRMGLEQISRQLTNEVSQYLNSFVQ